RLFEQLRDNAPEFSKLTAFQAGTLSVGLRRSGSAIPESLGGKFVTANYFDVFGVPAAAGRVLQPADDLPGAPPVAVLSYRAWMRYGLDPSVVGGSFAINGSPVTIVGVASAGFFGETIVPDPPGIWIPMGQ